MEASHVYLKRYHFQEDRRGTFFPCRLQGLRSRRLHGMASVLAMLYLVLFSMLAIGFYAGTTIATQVSRNEQRIDESQFAAESTMDWARRQMVRWNVTPGGTSSATYTALWAQVTATLNGTT